MKPILTALIAAACTAALLPDAAQAQSSDCTPIESVPAAISSSGKYCLAGDMTLNITSGQAIRINADNVTIDCRGNSITNTAMVNNAASVGIFATSRANLTIKNCRIVGGFTDGIRVTQPMGELNSSFYHRITDNYITAWRYGILAFGSAIEILDNTIWDVGGQASGIVAGIRIGGASQSQNQFQIVDRNTVVGTGSSAASAHAILSDGSIGALFRENTISGTISTAPGGRSYGILVSSGSANTVRDNHILGRGQTNETGIQMPANTGSLCFHNRIGVNNQPIVNCNTGVGNY